MPGPYNLRIKTCSIIYSFKITQQKGHIRLLRILQFWSLAFAALNKFIKIELIKMGDILVFGQPKVTAH